MDPFSPQARAEFLEYLVNNGLDGSIPGNDNKKRKKIMTLERYEENIEWITTHRKASNNEEKGRTHRARTDFRVQNGSLYRHNPNGQDGLRVATPLTAFDFIVGCHKASLHKGVRKTYGMVMERHYGITRDDVSAVLKHCQICILNRPNRTRAPLTPIVVDEWLERIQIDLIDLRAEADGHMKWICHIKDHFTKYSSLFATAGKDSEDIAKCISIFMMFLGIPEILQADNGGEFKKCVLRLVESHGIKVKNGRPRTPHIQGLVEQGNSSVKDSLRAWKEESGRKDWASALPEICWSMNATYHRSIKTTPYELVFGRKFDWRKHLSHHERISYTPPNEDIPLMEQDILREQEEQQLQPPSGEFTFHVPFSRIDQMHAGPSSNVMTTPTMRKHYLPVGKDPTANNITTIENLPSRLFSGIQFPPSLSSHNRILENVTTVPSTFTSPLTTAPNSPDLRPESEIFSYQSPCQSPNINSELAAKVIQHEMLARRNLAKARTDMTEKYSRHHKIEIFTVGQYVTVKVPREDRTSTDNRRLLCRVVGVAGSTTKPSYQLRCEYGLLQRLWSTSALAGVTAAIQQHQGDVISLSQSGNEITLAQAAANASTSNRAGVSCNCKKTCDTRRCRCFKNELRCSVYCHKDDDHDCGNLKPLSEHTELSLISHENWDYSGSCEIEDQNNNISEERRLLLETEKNRRTTRSMQQGAKDGRIRKTISTTQLKARGKVGGKGWQIEKDL